MLARLPRLGVLLPALLCAGCPAGVATTDGGVERAKEALSEVPVDDLADALDGSVRAEYARIWAATRRDADDD